MILPACSTTDSLEEAIQETPTDQSFTADEDNRKPNNR